MPDFSKYSKNYDSLLKASLTGAVVEHAFFADHKVALAARRLAGNTVRAVLDFGCGTGRGLQPIAARFTGAEVWAYDPSAACAEEAARQCPQAHVLSRPEYIPPKHFDCVFLCNVLHHVPEPDQADVLAACRSALAPGGSVFVFEHNPLNPLTRIVFERCPFDQDAAMLRMSKTITTGARAGLRPVQRGFCLFVPFAAGGIYRIEDMLGWLPLGAQYYVRFG